MRRRAQPKRRSTGTELDHLSLAVTVLMVAALPLAALVLVVVFGGF